MIPANDYSLLRCKHGLILAEDRDMISTLLRAYGEWAESSFLLMRQFLKEGDTVVDVGANIGCLTLAFAEAVGPSGSVLAFEAQRKVFYNLCTNLMMNNMSWVEAHQCLVSDKEGHAFLALRELDTANRSNINRGGKSFIGNLQNPTTQSGSDRIPIVTLDSHFVHRKHCNLIKIDVEGAEALVLRGAKNTILNHRPYLYAECGSQALFEQLRPLLSAFHYTPYWHPSLHYHSGNFRGTGNITGNKGDMNLLCLPSENREAMALAANQQLNIARDWAEIARIVPDFVF